MSLNLFLVTVRSPDNKFYAFDILVNNKFLSFEETEKLFQPFVGKFWHVTVWELQQDNFGDSEEQKILDYYDNKGAYEMLIARDNKPQQLTDLNSRQLLNIAKKNSDPLWIGYDKMFVFRQFPLEMNGVQKEALLVFAMGES